MGKLASGGPDSNMFITNVGLVTSDGPCGPNIMTAAWVHHVAYDPAHVAISVEPEDATLENILATRQFGVSLASDRQNVLASVSGRSSGRDVNKIALLQELGFKFYNAQKIGSLMVADAALNLEVELLDHVPLGSHVLLMGKVLVSAVNESVEPLAYKGGRFMRLGDDVKKPDQSVLDRIPMLTNKHKRQRI